jgi:hypothetical protein
MAFWSGAGRNRGQAKAMAKAAVKIWLLGAAAVVFLFPGCGPKKEGLPMSSDSVAVPYQEFYDSELFFYDGPYKRWVLKSDKMWKPIGDTTSLVGTPVHLTLFDSTGFAGSIVLADSGCAPPSMKKFTVWGNVYIRTFDSLKIKAEKIWWNQETHKVESNTFVEIQTPKGDVLRGKGLMAEEDFSSWSLIRSVSGTFPDFKKRIEQDEEF